MSAASSPSTKPVCHFDNIPDEIVQLIFCYTQPTALLRDIALVNRRCKKLVEDPILWRRFVFSDFTYWNPKTNIKASPANGQDGWKDIYLSRLLIADTVKRNINDMIRQQHGRIQSAENIAKYGYLAKDALLAEISCPDDDENVLARRYHATAVLDHIQRTIAIETWISISKGHNISHIQALNAFDLFILHSRKGDHQEVVQMINGLIDQIRTQVDMQSLTPRQKALAIQAYLKEHNLVNLRNTQTKDGSDYENIENNYLSLALQDPDHPSLPLISGVLYCYIASAFGLRAQLCNYPGHIYARLQPEAGFNMDGTTKSDINEPMFLDPWRGTPEVSLLQLQQGLVAMGVPDPALFEQFLTEASTASLVIRTSRNIIASVHANRNDESFVNGMGRQAESAAPASNFYADLDSAFYSALWANLILRPHNGDSIDEIRFLPMLLDNFERCYSLDTPLLERIVIGDGTPQNPGLDIPRVDEFHLPGTLAELRSSDAEPRQAKRRDSSRTSDDVKYRVGQVFRHKRYAYWGIICGWDVECTQNSEWMQHNRIDSLSRGRRQSFYHVLVHDSTLRYVAEENIVINTSPNAHQYFTGLAGKYMKRWDGEKMRFVSNVEDEYPDD